MANRRTWADSFGTLDRLAVGGEDFGFYSLAKLKGRGIERYPYCIKVLIENALRHEDGVQVEAKHVDALLRWRELEAAGRSEVPFSPSRVLLQDFTGVPVLVDLAAMRDAARALGGSPEAVNPLIPVDLVVDHSAQVDAWGRPDALATNLRLEHERNRERYVFMRWGAKAFMNFRVVPPCTGIVHQVNLEHLSTVVETRNREGAPLAFPDTVLGTDSHTTTVNGLGVVGWGVGGIEAEAAMLGVPLSLLLPRVLGVKLTGRLPEGATATDLVLTVTQALRRHGVVGTFVEFFGPGLDTLSLADRATIANMAPEYGATVGFFPVDDETLSYLRLTGREPERIALVEAYCKAQGLFRTPGAPEPEYPATMALDLGAVEPCVAGPKRPHDRVPLTAVKASFVDALMTPVKENGFGVSMGTVSRQTEVELGGTPTTLRHGSVVIAAITSCTNTSNPAVMVAAGLLAKKAVARGLTVPPTVKTSLSPGSRVVADYLDRAGLLPALEALGFGVVGYGCMTCIGNSGPLPEPVARAIRDNHLVAAAVLSGNRNFEGRVNPDTKANYLASPPLVVAYALAGRVDIDFVEEPLGTARDGSPVFLRDLWPTLRETGEALAAAVTPDLFRARNQGVFAGDATWKALPTPGGALFAWDEASTYLRRAPYFDGLTTEAPALRHIHGARALVVLGDSVTTDHISPAGTIKADSPAGQYLVELGVLPRDFNQYGARRGNHEVMMRGTFANIRLRNLLCPGTEGGITDHLPAGERMSIYDAAMRYRADGVPLVILAGREYGSGSSRDWAAKGPALLGVRAVIAISFERIHRSNLVEMGVLPLEFLPGQTRESLGLTGREAFDIEGFDGALTPGMTMTVNARREDGSPLSFQVKARLDTLADVGYYSQGGILPAVLRSLRGK
ncbi:MAG: aconitate hydratase AcnA [Candidatus Coatesbacteria bacterium]